MTRIAFLAASLSVAALLAGSLAVPAAAAGSARSGSAGSGSPPAWAGNPRLDGAAEVASRLSRASGPPPPCRWRRLPAARPRPAPPATSRSTAWLRTGPHCRTPRARQRRHLRPEGRGRLQRLAGVLLPRAEPHRLLRFHRRRQQFHRHGDAALPPGRAADRGPRGGQRRPGELLLREPGPRVGGPGQPLEDRLLRDAQGLEHLPAGLGAGRRGQRAAVLRGQGLPGGGPRRQRAAALLHHLDVLLPQPGHRPARSC